MKTIYGKIMLMAMTAVVLLTANLPCRAEESEQQSIWSEDEPGGRIKWFELTDEAAERIMNRLKQSDPQKADELQRLRDKDAEKFKAELRKVMRERFGKRFRQRGERFGRAGRKFKGHGTGMRRGMRRGMREEHSGHLGWLRENCPKEARRLAELKDRRPDLYGRRLRLGQRRYGRIARAAKESPELAKVLKEDLELKDKRNKLLREIRTAGDDEKQQLVEELRTVVGRRFDLVVKRKQMRYELLQKRIAKMQERVKKSEAEVEKWKSAAVRQKNVNERVAELISQTEKFNWK